MAYAIRFTTTAKSATAAHPAGATVTTLTLNQAGYRKALAIAATYAHAFPDHRVYLVGDDETAELQEVAATINATTKPAPKRCNSAQGN